MKNSFVLLIAFIASSLVIAQPTFESNNIKKSQVPKAVKSAQEDFYPTGDVTQWKEHSWSDNQGNEYIQYIAWFNVAGFTGKAYYAPNGQGKHSVVYMNGNDLPPSILNRLESDFPKYKAFSGEKVRLLNDNTYGYNVHLKNGKEQLNLWVDLSGREVESSRLVSSLKEAYKTTDLTR